MIRDITLGQYFPGETVVHRLDPRTKILLIILFIMSIFSAGSWVSYGTVLFYQAVSVALSRIKPRVLFRGLRPLVLIICITAILNMFYTPGEPILSIWRLSISAEGIEMAAFMVLRFMMLVTGTFLLTYTTSPLSLTDGIESLLGWMKKLRVPVHELSMVMSIALRFIPTLLEETDKIMNAQKARGADFESGGIVERAKALLPLLVPLFVSAIGRADELAIAMECRCYSGGEGRTHMKQLKYGYRDAAALITGSSVMAAVLLLKRYGM